MVDRNKNPGAKGYSSPTGRQRIGLFGGTFDPVHTGHLEVAEEVRERFDMEKIFLIPAALPPHKRTHQLARAKDRQEMIRLALAEYPGLCLSDVELNRVGPSYTVDTVAHFKALYKSGTELFFILGIDAFLEIDTWKSFGTLFERVPFVVMSRPGSRPSYDSRGSREIANFINTRIASGYRISRDGAFFLHPAKQRIFMHDTRPADISSTQIRHRIREGRSIDGLVPESVKQYIENKGIYDDRGT